MIWWFYSVADGAFNGWRKVLVQGRSQKFFGIHVFVIFILNELYIQLKCIKGCSVGIYVGSPW